MIFITKVSLNNAQHVSLGHKSGYSDGRAMARPTVSESLNLQ